jgi:hypothetical protein
LPELPPGPLDPEEKRINRFLVERAESLVREVADRYRWSENHTSVIRSAFINAGLDHVCDLAMTCKRQEKNRELLAAHLPGLMVADYQSRLKGSFQNFIVAIERKWYSDEFKFWKPFHTEKVKA